MTVTMMRLEPILVIIPPIWAGFSQQVVDFRLRIESFLPGLILLVAKSSRVLLIHQQVFLLKSSEPSLSRQLIEPKRRRVVCLSIIFTSRDDHRFDDLFVIQEYMMMTEAQFNAVLRQVPNVRSGHEGPCYTNHCLFIDSIDEGRWNCTSRKISEARRPEEVKANPR
jgi:hypothetical protein